MHTPAGRVPVAIDNPDFAAPDTDAHSALAPTSRRPSVKLAGNGDFEHSNTRV